MKLSFWKIFFLKFNIRFYNGRQRVKSDLIFRSPPSMPKLYINRRAAMEHRLVPSADVHYKNSVFSQMFDGLKPRDPSQKPLDFRFVFTLNPNTHRSILSKYIKCLSLYLCIYLCVPFVCRCALFYIQNYDSDM